MRRFSQRPSGAAKGQTLHVIAALDYFDAQRWNLRDRRVDLMSVVSAVCPYEFEPWKTVADFIEHKRCSIAVLQASRMDDDAQGQGGAARSVCELTLNPQFES